MRLVFWIGLLLAVSVLASMRAQDDAAYAGSETCVVCHEEAGQTFPRNPHHALEQEGRWGSAGRGCESCHGPGAEHAETTDATKILRMKPGEASAVNRACLACHQGSETQRGRLFGSHDRNSLACTSCHSVHKAAQRPLLVSESDTLCASCHLDVRAAFNRPFTHRLPEKAISCVDCHNPHGGPPPSSLTRVSANEPACLKCHADKRGPFPFEHAPVKIEPCTVCHEPHGSSNPRMMTRHNVAQLCLECHAGSMSAVGGVPPSSHDLQSARFQNCTVCHTKVHGSFVNRDLLR